MYYYRLSKGMDYLCFFDPARGTIEKYLEQQKAISWSKKGRNRLLNLLQRKSFYILEKYMNTISGK